MPEVFLRSKKKVKSKLFLLLVGRETKMSRLLTKITMVVLFWVKLVSQQPGSILDSRKKADS